jgi:hypothetical protein
MVYNCIPTEYVLCLLGKHSLKKTLSSLLLCEGASDENEPFVALTLYSRVSFETSFDSKYPKLEPKPDSALYKKNVCFGVSIKPKQTQNLIFGLMKQTENNRSRLSFGLKWKYFLLFRGHPTLLTFGRNCTVSIRYIPGSTIHAC